MCTAVVYIVAMYVAIAIYFGLGLRISEEKLFYPPVDCLHMSATQLADVLGRSVAGFEMSPTTQNDFHQLNVGTIVIAIGGGITSKNSAISANIHNVNESTLLNLVFFKSLLKSFCRTAGGTSERYHYRFYLGYDHDDPFFTDRRACELFRRTFDTETARHCRPRSVDTSLKLVACRHSGRPAWAQNDAMLDAYLDGVNFFYRINDDTELVTGNWTDKFISVLEGSNFNKQSSVILLSAAWAVNGETMIVIPNGAPIYCQSVTTLYDPPLVGVVGPHDNGGNKNIMTYDFVHRTHVEIFGFYYPRVFGDWFGDDWMTLVYQPHRSTKVREVQVVHLWNDPRYKINDYEGAARQLELRLAVDKKALDRFISTARANANRSSLMATDASPGRRIFAILLNSSEPRMIWGAIRNAQLVRVLMPDWQLRVCVPSTVATMTSIFESRVISGGIRSTCSIPVERRVIASLQRLGANILTVSGGHTLLHNVLTSPDIDHIDYVLLRRAEWRLGEKETAAIYDWVRAAEQGGPDAAVVHCIHDDVIHARNPLVHDLWGFRPGVFRRHFHANGINLSEVLRRMSNDVEDDADSFLNMNVWPVVADVAYCHDSVQTCHGGLPAGESIHFPEKVYHDDGFVGQYFDENHVKINDTATRARLIPCRKAEVTGSKNNE